LTGSTGVQEPKKSATVAYGSVVSEGESWDLGYFLESVDLVDELNPAAGSEREEATVAELTG
jgi:hypothetical protein